MRMQRNSSITHLLGLLGQDDLDLFLIAYERYHRARAVDCTRIPQVRDLLSATLRRRFREDRFGASFAKLYLLTEFDRILPVDDDVQKQICQRFDRILRTKSSSSSDTKPLSQPRRVSIVSTFAIQMWPGSDAIDTKRNLCDSGQEREFLRAIRQYFPSMVAHPNITLRSFINLDGLGASYSERLRRYARNSRVDVLLCTLDEDPIAGFELDSAWHEGWDAASRDEMKNELFQLAGIPLIRIRPKEPAKVLADDFYDLLVSEQGLDLIRPARLNSRRKFDGLASTGTVVARE